MPSRTVMPVKPPQPVVVTGANGFIAQHCVAALLSQGYRVIGTVRTASKAAAVAATHKSHPKLSIVVIEDITDPKAYLAQLQIFAPSAILHLAAPFTYDTGDYERDLMIPAQRGSLAVLAAAEEMSSVQRVVQTNSFACVYDAAAGPAPGKTYSSRDWSPLTYEDGVRAMDAPTAYRASKTAAERAAWDWVKRHKPRFDLVSLCPVMVFGAFLPFGGPASIDDLNTSNRIVNAVVSAGGSSPMPPTRAPVWVDVRDVALAHVRALSTPEAGGARFLLAAGVYCNQQIADVAREVSAAQKFSVERIPTGEPGRREAHLHFDVDVTDAEQVLGIDSWRTLGECLEQLLPQLSELELCN